MTLKDKFQNQIESRFIGCIMVDDDYSGGVYQNICSKKLISEWIDKWCEENVFQDQKFISEIKASIQAQFKTPNS